MFTGLSNMEIVDSVVYTKKLPLKLTVTLNTVVWVFIHTGCMTPPCAPVFSLLPWLQDRGCTWTPQQSAGLTANTALCHGVH